MQMESLESGNENSKSVQGVKMLRHMSKNNSKSVLNDKDMNQGRKSALPPKLVNIGRNQPQKSRPGKAMTPIDHAAAQKKLNNILEKCKSNEADSHNDMIKSLPNFKER